MENIQDDFQVQRSFSLRVTAVSSFLCKIEFLVKIIQITGICVPLKWLFGNKGLIKVEHTMGTHTLPDIYTLAIACPQVCIYQATHLCPWYHELQ